MSTGANYMWICIAVRAAVFCLREDVQGLSPEVYLIYNMKKMMRFVGKNIVFQDSLLFVDTVALDMCLMPFFLGGFWLQILQHVLLDLPGILFFTTYTLLVLFWAEIYHQVFYSDAYFHPAGMYVLLFHKARGVCDLFHFCDGQDSRLILRFLFCFRLEASLLINCAQPFSSQMQQFTLFRCVLEKQNSLI